MATLHLAGTRINIARLHGLWLLAFIAVSYAACGGSPSSPTAPSSTTNSSVSATLSSIQGEIFTPRCVGCHGDVSNGGLDLRASVAFANLVNTRSSQSSLLRVAPGDLESSYLVHKLDGRSGILGNRMPQGGPFLSTAELDAIKDWITAGALNN